MNVVHIVQQHESKHEYGHTYCLVLIDEGFYGDPESRAIRVERTLLPPSCLACIVAR